MIRIITKRVQAKGEAICYLDDIGLVTKTPYKAHILPVTLFEAETWTFTKYLETKFGVF